MSDLNLEVWEPEPIIPVPGTYVSRFNRYYLAINPNPVQGPPTWRISDPDEFPCGDGIVIPVPPDQEYFLASFAPLIIQGDSLDVDISLDISTVPEIDVDYDRTPITIDGFDKPPMLTSVKDNPVLVAIDVNDKAALLTLSFGNLPNIPDTVRKNLNVAVEDYNSREYSEFETSYSSTDPIELNPYDGLTQVTLNINSLPPAP